MLGITAGTSTLRRLILTAVAVPLMAGCALTGGLDPVYESALPPADLDAAAGPVFVEVVNPNPFADTDGVPRVVVHDGTDEVDLGKVRDVAWLPTGDLLLRTGQQRGRDRMSVVDPTGSTRGPSRPTDFDVGITPEAVTVVSSYRDTRFTVYSPDLRHRQIVDVDPAVVETNQIGPNAPFHLHSRPYTLDGVTYVEWSINSEDDTLTDHGGLRVEGDEVTEFLRNEPLVSLRPSYDGAALLAIMQDNGEDEDCGGCVVEQRIVELDPATGEIAADYGMPPGYTREWRVERVDKRGDVVGVRFWFGSDDQHRETWLYDGEWHEVEDLADTRTVWQAGDALTWRQTDGRDVGEGASFELSFDGEEVLSCRVRGRRDDPCPLIEAPGSLISADATEPR